MLGFIKNIIQTIKQKKEAKRIGEQRKNIERAGWMTRRPDSMKRIREADDFDRLIRWILDLFYEKCLSAIWEAFSWGA